MVMCWGKMFLLHVAFVDSSGRMRVVDGRLCLIREGIYISDSIISDFMIV